MSKKRVHPRVIGAYLGRAVKCKGVGRCPTRGRVAWECEMQIEQLTMELAECADATVLRPPAAEGAAGAAAIPQLPPMR